MTHNFRYRFFVTCASEGHVFYEKKNKKLYGFGFNSQQQLGFVPKTPSDPNCHLNKREVLSPTQVLPFFWKENLRVKKISAGDKHTIILTTKHIAYGCGSNYLFQLGLKNQNDISEYGIPTKLECFSNNRVLDVCCGLNFSVFVLNDKIMACGSNYQYQCGTGDGNEYSFNLGPKKVLLPINDPEKELKECGCGDWFALYLKNNGDLYRAGKINEEEDSGNIPSLVTMGHIVKGKPILVDKIYYGLYHIFIKEKKSGNFYGSGYNADKQISPLIDERDINDLTYLKNLSDMKHNIKDIRGGHNHTVILLNDGNVFACGNENAYGMGKIIQKRVLHILRFNNIIQIEVGMYTTYLFEKLKMWAAGNNSKGQLGWDEKGKDQKDSFRENKIIKLQEVMVEKDVNESENEFFKKLLKDIKRGKFVDLVVII